MADISPTILFTRDNARKIDQVNLRGLVESIREIGIINPLRVRPVKRHVNGELADAYEVTAGAHRLQAALKLGLETVPCIVVEDDDLRAELAMIDENLCRANLSPTDEAKQTARRKEIYIELHPETKQGAVGRGGYEKARQLGDHSGDENVVRFTEATASATGKSERAVQRAAERGEKIAGDILDTIRGSRFDNGAYLDMLKKLGPKEQRMRVQRDLARQNDKPTKRGVQPKNDDETFEEWRASFMRIWNRGSKEWRELVLAEIDRPVMDMAAAS